MGNDIPYDIYLEIGQKKTFACAVDWPGWCRSGRDEASAIQALLRSGSRYAGVLETAHLSYTVPQSPTDIHIIERITGNFSTDFGVPDLPISQDFGPIHAEEIGRYKRILRACWLAFDKVVKSAQGKELQKGPRGGGRDLAGIINHVAGAEPGYLRRIGGKANIIATENMDERLSQIRNETLKGLQAAFDGQLSVEGPKGGKRWPLPYFVRRVAWHVIDHAWEIEDRIL